MRVNWSGSQPLLQAFKGRREPGSPRKRRLRALGALAAAVLLAAAVVAGGTAVAKELRKKADGNGEGGAGNSSGNVVAEPWTVRGMEQAYQGLKSSDNPAAALADSESLAAARHRARKAAALPPPEYRSHSEGVSLSAGAADVAARCVGPGCDLLKRFVLATGEAARLLETGGCAVQHCPDALGVGLRPLPYTSHALGNRCEPLWNRGAIEVVRQLAEPGWRVLEWHTGSSTTWFLSRLAQLTSVEGAPGFANTTAVAAAAQFERPFLDSHWRLHVEPPRGRVLTFEQTESAELWDDYCSVRFVPPGTVYDVVAVQGFARMACLKRALSLLRSQGGLLVLPQAQRPAYAGAAALVPPHWLRLTDTHAFGTTHVWMSIRQPGEVAAAGEENEDSSGSSSGVASGSAGAAAHA